MQHTRVRCTTLLTYLFAGAALLAAPKIASAQVSVGAYVGSEFDNQNNWILYGAEARMPIKNSFDGNFRFTYHPYGSGASSSQFDLNAIYNWQLAHPNKLAPYVGIGGALVHFSAGDVSENKVGLNIISGTKLILDPNSRIQPFMNMQYTIVREYPNSYTLTLGASYLFGHASKAP